MPWIYNMLYIYSVPIGHTTYTKAWDKIHYNRKTTSEVPWTLWSALCNVRMTVALFEFLTVGKVPQTLHHSFLKIGQLLEATDLGPNRPLTLTCGLSWATCSLLFLLLFQDFLDLVGELRKVIPQLSRAHDCHIQDLFDEDLHATS